MSKIFQFDTVAHECTDGKLKLWSGRFCNDCILRKGILGKVSFIDWTLWGLVDKVNEIRDSNTQPEEGK